MHERARDHSVDAIKTGETAKPGVPDDAAPKRRARMPQEASSRARPYPSNPRNQPHIARGSAAAGRCLREREGRFASFLTPAPSGTDLPPLATQHAGKIGSRFQSVERKVTQHFNRFDERSASPDSLFSLLWIRRSRWLEYAPASHAQLDPPTTLAPASPSASVLHSFSSSYLLSPRGSFLFDRQL